MNLVSALQQADTTTENGMATNSSTLSDCLDLFFKAGASRSADSEDIIRQFSLAFNDSPLEALKVLFWARDIREGAGERRFFKICLGYLSESHPEALKKNMGLISEYGRWDDLLSLTGTCVEKEAFEIIKNALDNKNGLCAKWMPRKGSIANFLRKFLGLSPKEYRKLLVGLTQVVEQDMCAKTWDKIDYSKVPSLAAARYQKAFTAKDFERYTEYISLLKSPDPNKKVKINASAVYPYDVIKSMKKGNTDVAEEQWKALPDYLEGAEEMILPLIDVSGSMDASVSEGKNLTCMDVAISLGLYISERNNGPFKDHFITFSERPQLQKLNGSLRDRLHQMSGSEWGMNTNLQSVFKLILKQAITHNVKESEMPAKILIVSDMEFDAAISDGASAMDMIRSEYEESGYRLPTIIFWNVQSRGKNFPVRFNEEGTALISGFSPSIMKSILGGKSIDPYSVMMDTINTERYENISI